MARDKVKPLERRAPVSGQQREAMLQILLRSASAFLQARDRLLPAMFGEHEQHLRLTWQAALNYYETANRLPTRDKLTVEISTLLENLPDELDEDDVTSLNDFVDQCFLLRKKDIRADDALGWLNKFLDDKLGNEVVTDLTDVESPKDIEEYLLRKARQAAQHRGLQATELQTLYPLGWDTDQLVVESRTTGIPFLDTMLGKGNVCREAHGLLAPYGGGKTLTFVAMASAMAKNSYNRWADSLLKVASGERKKPIPLGIVYYFSYEEPINALRIRALSCIAKIPKDTLVEVLEFRDYSRFSTDSKPKPYERRLFASQFSQQTGFLGEYSRFMFGQRRLDKTLRVVDMTGADDRAPNRGFDLTSEIATIVGQDQNFIRSQGINCRVENVVVDYVKAAAIRHLEFYGKDNSELRHVIGSFPFNLKLKVGIPFNCPTWSCHQLSAVANSYKPGVKVHHTDAAEAKAYAENLDFCFVFGTMTEDQLAVLWNTKARRKRTHPEVVVRINGGMASLEDVSGIYTVNSGAIIDRVAANSVARATPVESPYDEDGPLPGNEPTTQQQLVRSQQGSVLGRPSGNSR